MKRNLTVFLFALMTLLVPVSVMAQDSGDMQARLELAEKMQALRPARQQVDDAISTYVQMLPEEQRVPFQTALEAALNYKALERISIDAYAQVFTEEELSAMVDYYSKPEARSASDKYNDYAKIVQPEIIRMLDQAMMRLRSGAQQ